MSMLNIPTFRIELDGLRFNLKAALSDRHGEMQDLINKGIDLAIQKLPALIVARVQQAVDSGIIEAVAKATENYFSPGGEGYSKIITEVSKQFEKKQLWEG